MEEKEKTEEEKLLDSLTTDDMTAFFNSKKRILEGFVKASEALSQPRHLAFYGSKAPGVALAKVCLDIAKDEICKKFEKEVRLHALDLLARKKQQFLNEMAELFEACGGKVEKGDEGLEND